MNRPLRIAIITTDARHWMGHTSELSPNFGTAVRGLLQGFDQISGVEIHVISASPSRLCSPIMLSDSISFYHVYVPKWGWGKTLFGGVVRAVRKKLQRIQPDLVHGQGTERDCAMVAVGSGFPNVLTLHGNMQVHAKRPENRGNLYYRLAAFLEKRCLRKTDGVVAISNYTKDLVAAYCDRTWLLPNAVDPRFFEIVNQAQGIPRFLVVGSIDVRKNPIGLIEACAGLLKDKRCRISFAGSGNPACAYFQEFQRLAAELPGIEVMGFLDRESLATQFAEATALVLPTFEDNCPMVVLEAMAAGLPVLASRVGGIPDLIQHGHDGLMFDPTEPSEITPLIERIVADAALRQMLGSNARETALARFHPKVIAEAHLQIYEEVLALRRAGETDRFLQR